MKPKAVLCKSCGAGIYWAVTKTGKKMPVDEQPTSKGNVLLSIDPKTDTLKAHVLKRGEEVEPGRNRYTSHFNTCAAADEHRRGR